MHRLPKGDAKGQEGSSKQKLQNRRSKEDSGNQEKEIRKSADAPEMRDVSSGKPEGVRFLIIRRSMKFATLLIDLI